MGEYTPLSVRYGNRRVRFGWKMKGWREALALRLAPWLTGQADLIHAVDVRVDGQRIAVLREQPPFTEQLDD